MENGDKMICSMCKSSNLEKKCISCRYDAEMKITDYFRCMDCGQINFENICHFCKVHTEKPAVLEGELCCPHCAIRIMQERKMIEKQCEWDDFECEELDMIANFCDYFEFPFRKAQAIKLIALGDPNDLEKAIALLIKEKKELDA